jgi:hypothetical protein
VQALRQVGAVVWPLGEPVDLLVRFHGRDYFIDCKTPRKLSGGTPRKTTQQVAFEQAGWVVYYPQTVAEALAVLGVRFQG